MMTVSNLPTKRKPLPQRRRQLDEIDLRLIDALRGGGRRSQEELARGLALSRPAIRERMRRLERTGIIKRYTVDLDWDSLGFRLLAFVSVRFGGGSCHGNVERVKALSDERATVVESHAVTGHWCLLAKVRAYSSADLDAFIERIRRLPGIESTETMVVLSTMAD